MHTCGLCAYMWVVFAEEYYVRISVTACMLLNPISVLQGCIIIIRPCNSQPKGPNINLTGGNYSSVFLTAEERSTSSQSDGQPTQTAAKISAGTHLLCTCTCIITMKQTLVLSPDLLEHFLQTYPIIELISVHCGMCVLMQHVSVTDDWVRVE